MIKAAVALIIWTLFVWVPRIRNIWTDDDLSSDGQLWRTALALVLIGGAVYVAARLLADRTAAQRTTRTAIVGFAVLTIVVWVVRGGQILVGDWDTGFKVVHSVLAAVSIGLSGWALSGLRGRLTQ